MQIGRAVIDHENGARPRRDEIQGHAGRLGIRLICHVGIDGERRVEAFFAHARIEQRLDEARLAYT